MLYMSKIEIIGGYEVEKLEIHIMYVASSRKICIILGVGSIPRSILSVYNDLVEIRQK
jgi:hypothetical protein